MVFLISFAACRKESDDEQESIGFVLSSPEIGQDSLLPVDYTCDGSSSTLLLVWQGFSEVTQSFALIMHHEASPTDIHWYWVMYNIPADVQSLVKNVTGVGTLGINSVNENAEYAGPCSQGPGLKRYTLTLYALSQQVSLTVPNSEFTRDVLLEAIKDITLASTTLTVVYSRDI